MRKTLLIILLGISLLALGAKFANFAPGILGIRENTGIRVFSSPDGADVLLDNQIVGKTPYQNDSLEAKEMRVKLQSEVGSWEGQVRLGSRTVAVVNRTLAKDKTAQAGETLTLEAGQGVSVISSPSTSVIEVDGQALGQTPGFYQVTSGDHTFLISHPGFLNRSIKATVPLGYRLVISADLAVSEVETPTPSPSPPASVPTVLVKSTPTGFLRVRDQASISGKEIAQVKPGDELELLEELNGWDKVKLKDGTEGFVSSQYVSKK